MKRLLLILLALIILVPLAIVAWLALFFDANDYREQMADGFQKATGREINIAGDLNTSFFPWIGIETGAIEVANAAGFGDAPLAAIKGSKIHLKLRPLFSGEIEMDTVVLDGLQANLVTLADGKTNWDFTAASSSDSNKKTDEETSSDDAGKALAALAIGGIEMKDASITWDDRKGGTKLDLTAMNLETGAISFDTPIAVSFNTGFAMNGDEMKGNMKATTGVVLSSDLQKVNLNKLNLDFDATGTVLEGGKLKTGLKSDINVDLATQLVSSDKLTFDMDLAGDIAPVNPMKIAVNSPLKINLATMVIDLPTMQYSVPGSEGSGSLNLSNLDKPMPTIKMKLKTDKFDATPWMGTATTQTGLNTIQNTIQNRIQIEQLLLSLMSIRSVSAAEKSTPVDIPVEMIRQLDVDASLNIASFIMDTLQASDVAAVLKAKKGVILVEPMSAKLFGGSSNGMMELDARADIPKFHLKEDLTGVQIAQVMKYSMGKDSKDWISGTADMDADIRTQGPDTVALTKALSGTVNAKVKDGAFEGFSVRKMLQQANALLKGQTYVDDGSPNRTKILEMGSATKLVNGVAISDNIKVLTPLADLTGSGSANLNTEQLDYRLKLALSSGISEIDKAEFKKLEGKSLPLKVSGSFSDPNFNIDVEKAAKEEVKEQAEKKLRKKFGDKYGKELDMLFGR
jgi:AsmA protein